MQITIRLPLLIPLLTLLTVAIGHKAIAAPLVFFGEDLNSVPTQRLTSTPDSDAAKAGFLSNLTADVSSDFNDLESLTPGVIPASGVVVPFVAAGVNVTLTAASATVVNLPTGVSPGTGGLSGKQYPTSGDQYIEFDSTAGALTVSFDNPISAFAFSGVDVGDTGDLVLDLILTGTGGAVLDVPHSIFPGPGNQNPDGGVMFYGFIFDDGSTVDSITFSNAQNTRDFLAFDDFVVATANQIVQPPVRMPVPGTIYLMLSLLMFFRIRRHESVG